MSAHYYQHPDTNAPLIAPIHIGQRFTLIGHSRQDGTRPAETVHTEPAPLGMIQSVLQRIDAAAPSQTPRHFGHSETMALVHRIARFMAG